MEDVWGGGARWGKMHAVHECTLARPAHTAGPVAQPVAQLSGVGKHARAAFSLAPTGILPTCARLLDAWFQI